MLPNRINREVCLAEVPYFSNAFQHIKLIKNTSTLRKALLSHCKTAEEKSAIKQYLSSHIGHSTFFTRIFGGDGSQQEKMVRKYLSFIVAALDGKVEGLEIAPDKKMAMMAKLTEGIQHCHEGYLNRVYIVLGALQQPQTVNQLLAAYRLHLVEKAYQSFNVAEVHAHHRFFVLANEMGYAIPYEEVNDRYVGAIVDSRIHDSLKSVFKKWYEPRMMVKHVWEHAQLELLGYVGKREPGEGYTVGDYEGIMNYFRKLLEKTDLGVMDCFVVDEDTYAILDIDWRKIHSYLIQYFEERHYFNAFENEQCFEIKTKLRTLTYRCNPEAVREGVLIHAPEDGEKQYQYGLDTKSSLMDDLSPFFQKKLNEWLPGVYLRHLAGAGLSSAISRNDIAAVGKAIQTMRANNALVWQVGIEGNGPLHKAALTCGSEVIKLLIQYGADVTLKNKAGKTPIQLAAENGKWEAVEAFAENYQDSDDKAHYGDVLRRAVIADRLGTVKKLVASKLVFGWLSADNKVSLTWCSPDSGNGLLHHAALNNNPDIVTLLIRHGADAAGKNNAGKTPIELAAEGNHWKAVEALANVKTDDYQNYFGDVLQKAVKANRVDTVKKLLTSQWSRGWFGVEDKLLLKSPSFSTDNRLLHHAVANNNLEMVMLLIQEGADTTVENIMGQTPLTFAMSLGYLNCVTALTQATKSNKSSSVIHSSSLWAQQESQINADARSRLQMQRWI